MGKPVAAGDAPLTRLAGRFDELSPEPLVVPLQVVMLHVLPNHAPKMALAITVLTPPDRRTCRNSSVNTCPGHE